MKSRFKFTDEQLKDLHGRGMTDVAMAEQFGVSRAAVFQRRQALKLKSNAPPRVRRPLPQSHIAIEPSPKREYEKRISLLKRIRQRALERVMEG